MSGPAAASRARQRGFALLIVLWTMSLLALIGTQVTSAGRAETRLAANLRQSAVAELAAEGAVFQAIYHLLDGSRAHWPADGLPRQIKTDQAVTVVVITDERRKITLNNSTLPMLLGLMRAVQLPQTQAVALAAQIIDWRSPSVAPLEHGAKAPQYRAAGRAYGPPAQPFRSAEEIGLLLDMTPEAFARLRPYMSPYIESAPRAQDMDPVIAAAMGDAQSGGAPALAFEEPTTVTIVATATSGSARFTRQAVVRIANTEDLPTPTAPAYTILDWTTKPD